jgi:cell division septation protein DedD
MSLKRSHTSTRSMPGAGSDSGTKLGRQEFFDELKKHAQTAQVFTPVDIAMAIGASEAAVSRALLGLAAEGYLEKVEVGKYRSTPFQEVPQAEFLKALSRASKTDSTRQRDLSEIARLKQNNDVMRAKLLGALAERDHYLAVLKQHGIDPGPAPAPVRPESPAPAPTPAAASESPVPAPAAASESPAPSPAAGPAAESTGEAGESSPPPTTEQSSS